MESARALPASASTTLRDSELSDGPSDVSREESVDDFWAAAAEKLEGCEAGDAEKIECVLRQIYSHLYTTNWAEAQVGLCNGHLWRLFETADEEKLLSINEAFVELLNRMNLLLRAETLQLFTPYLRQFERFSPAAHPEALKPIYAALKSIHVRGDKLLRANLITAVEKLLSDDVLSSYGFWFVHKIRTCPRRITAKAGGNGLKGPQKELSLQSFSAEKCSSAFLKRNRETVKPGEEKYAAILGAIKFSFENLPDSTRPPSPSNDVCKALFAG